MLRRAENARFEPVVRFRVFGTAQPTGRRWFMVGKAKLWTLDQHDFQELTEASADWPAFVGVNKSRTYWLYEGTFYWENDGLKSDEVRALIQDAQRRRTRRIERAKLSETSSRPGLPRRPSIADEVKTFVWQRDNGECVRCGSNQALEFDHIIPVVMGGSHTARNLQLLCEPCNRAKGGDL